MSFVDAVKLCLARYADFTGRATRPEFWWFVLFTMLVQLVASMLGRYVYGLAIAALVLPGVAVGARRLHDIGKSGWLQLVYFIPFVGWLILLYWLVQPSDGPNQFGNPAVTPDSPTVMPGPGA